MFEFSKVSQNNQDNTLLVGDAVMQQVCCIQMFSRSFGASFYDVKANHDVLLRSFT